MRVSFKQFLSPTHSWGTVGTSIARELKNMGHELALCSTNGYDNFPEDLREYVICENCTTPQKMGKQLCGIKGGFDISFAYTMMTHFPEYLKFGKNRFGCWNLDGTIIPKGYVKAHHGATKVLPSSEFSRRTFEENGVPKDKLFVVPHGYSDTFTNRDVVYDLKTDRKRKVLVNIQQCHTRKNIPGLLEVWGKTFSDKDDVVLIAKVKDKKPEAAFEISWRAELDKFKKRYRNHAPIIVVNKFIDDMSDLYRACDIVFSMSHVECFLLPALEGLASNKLVIASGGENCCGNVDFMNDNNSMLIKGKPARAPFNYQYWKSSTYGEMFQPDKTHASELLLKAVNEYDSLIEKFSPGMQEAREKYTWKNVAKQILDLCE